ncbi:MAG: hypothetical protein RLZZ358_504, partial [Bacteroidota bacterium]
ALYCFIKGVSWPSLDLLMRKIRIVVLLNRKLDLKIADSKRK